MMSIDVILTLNIENQLLQQGAKLIPEDFQKVFSPASLYLYEWQTYWLELSDVDGIIVGPIKVTADHGNWYPIRFENQLGLTRISPIIHGRLSTTPVFVEVISSKFETLETHHFFYSSILNTLFQRIANLPFTYQADTGRGVKEALRPPTPLFTYYFLKHYGAEIRSSISEILASSHRILIDEELLLPIGSASTVDADAMISMIRQSSLWTKAQGHPLAARLGGYVPTHIQQHLPQETYDTPENRFVKNFILSLQATSENLYSQPWWGNVSQIDQRSIRETHSLLQQTVLHPIFEEVGEQYSLPSNSQVLLRKEGYREFLMLWQLFQQARRPLFEPITHAIDTRNIAQLYEFWVFFQLIETVSNTLKVTPVLELRTSEERGLEWSSVASFGSYGLIRFNRSYLRRASQYHSYSTSMRPDFTWEVNGKPVAIFDAKFKFSLRIWFNDEDEMEEIIRKDPTLDDLYKMHTYRDALGVKSAVILYPGESKVFFDVSEGKLETFELNDILSGKLSGIGAFPMKPEKLLFG